MDLIEKHLEGSDVKFCHLDNAGNIYNVYSEKYDIKLDHERITDIVLNYFGFFDINCQYLSNGSFVIGGDRLFTPKSPLSFQLSSQKITHGSGFTAVYSDPYCNYDHYQVVLFNCNKVYLSLLNITVLIHELSHVLDFILSKSTIHNEQPAITIEYCILNREFFDKIFDGILDDTQKLYDAFMDAHLHCLKHSSEHGSNKSEHVRVRNNLIKHIPKIISCSLEEIMALTDIVLS